MADQKRGRLSADALISLVLFVAVAGHVGGFWNIPRWEAATPSISSPAFDPRSVTVAFSRVRTGGVTPWRDADTDAIKRRFVERWSEATGGRSQIVLLEDTAIRDVLIVFSRPPLNAFDADRVLPFVVVPAATLGFLVAVVLVRRLTKAQAADQEPRS